MLSSEFNFQYPEYTNVQKKMSGFNIEKASFDGILERVIKAEDDIKVTTQEEVSLHFDDD